MRCHCVSDKHMRVYYPVAPCAHAQAGSAAYVQLEDGERVMAALPFTPVVMVGRDKMRNVEEQEPTRACI